MRRAVVGALLVAMALSGCAVNRLDTSESDQPPDGWSKTAVIDKTVKTGSLLVRLDSETCHVGVCLVRETVTNRSDEIATFNCSTQTAATSTGKVVDQYFVTLGSGGGGCSFDLYPGYASPWQIPPGASRTFEARFYTEGDVGISRVFLPGSEIVDVPVLVYSR